MSKSLPGPCDRLSPRQRSAALGMPLSLVIVLSSCASVPPDPSAALGAANQAIATADRSGVTDASAPDLVEARSKLAAANAAVAADHPMVADRLAREARVDAELATARNQTAQAQTVNDAIRQGTATLSNEVQRNSGAQP